MGSCFGNLRVEDAASVVSQGNGPTALDGALSQSSEGWSTLRARVGWVGLVGPGPSTGCRSMIGEEYRNIYYIYYIFTPPVFFGLMSFFLLVHVGAYVQVFCLGGVGKCLDEKKLYD